MSQNKKAGAPQPHNRIIFRTYSLCPICVFMDKKSTTEYISSVVMIQPPNRVWYVYICPKHGQQEVLYSSNVDYFFRLLKFSPGLLDPPTNGVGDIEELRKRTKYSSAIKNHPFILSLDVLPEDNPKTVCERLDFAVREIGYGKRVKKDFLIKLIGKTDNSNQLNEIANFVIKHTSQKYAVMLDLPFHKFSRLLKVDSTVLLQSLVYPCVRIYIEKGREDKNLDELRRLYRTLSKVRNMQSVVQIVVSRPLPDLTGILRLVREKKGLCRYIVIEYERTPRFMQNHFRPPSKDVKDHFIVNEDGSNNLDIYELLAEIQRSTAITTSTTTTSSLSSSSKKKKVTKIKKSKEEEEKEEIEGEEEEEENNNEELILPQLTPNDFYPVSIAMVVEEFLRSYGMGDYNIRPSPLCGVATILVNSETKNSIPISHFFDIDGLFQSLLPLQKKNALDSMTLNWFKLKKYRKILQAAVKKNSKLPKNLLSYLNPLDQEKQKILHSVVTNSQILMVHNNVDLACVDVGKRTRCSFGYIRGNSREIKSSCMFCV